LYNQVKSILALDKEFVLKYKDEEGDLITISSDEELSCALGYSQGNILRLTAIYEGVNTELTHVPVSCEFEEVGTDQQMFGRGCHRFRGRGRWEHGPYDRHMQDTHHSQHERRCNRWEFKKEKMNMRREMLKETINDMTKKQEQGQLTPHQVQRLAGLQDKLRRLDSIVLNWEEKAKDREQWWKEKGERQKAKHEKNEERKKDCPRVELTVEMKEELDTTKAKILSLKGEIYQLKLQLSEKKKLLKEAPEGNKGELLKNEVKAIKVSILEVKKQIFPLKQRVRQLHNGQC
jgi:hypothetical protein